MCGVDGAFLPSLLLLGQTESFCVAVAGVNDELEILDVMIRTCLSLYYLVEWWRTVPLRVFHCRVTTRSIAGETNVFGPP
mmetsp:Transcript_7886/g.15850  ORF Transcript_7886/g.15850 Transcript_7886/m.15850 type:complete len:80 (+) Transcript_7886:1706-1945(+)